MTPIRIHSDDPRLGRRINHDPRSRDYRLDTAGLTLQSVEWPIHIPVLDQGQTGKCTAESSCEALASDPFWPTLDAGIQSSLNDSWTDTFYSDEETLDGDGPYPPNDFGSDGLTAAKVAKSRGLISGYEHTFTSDDALLGVQKYPALWGTLWKTGMDNYDASGRVRYSGSVRGGHELCIYKIDAANEQVWFRNSWGAWGYKNEGIAWISFADFAKSLADQGDITFFVPRSQPAPVPNPPDPNPSSGLTVTITNQAVIDQVTARAARKSETPGAWVENRLEKYFG